MSITCTGALGPDIILIINSKAKIVEVFEKRKMAIYRRTLFEAYTYFIARFDRRQYYLTSMLKAWKFYSYVIALISNEETQVSIKTQYATLLSFNGTSFKTHIMLLCYAIDSGTI